ncbi:MAG TPA: hypothetical protein VKI65_18545 [Gemmataceae bacterium]|nr:hypothetical protein [Gemmataceae bacterium]
MPLTPLQKDVLRVLASNRNPESHVAGGAVINRLAGSPRYSADLDLFHDVAERVGATAVTTTGMMLPHLGHFTLRPARPSPTFSRLPQPSQAMWIGMVRPRWAWADESGRSGGFARGLFLIEAGAPSTVAAHRP